MDDAIRSGRKELRSVLDKQFPVSVYNRRFLNNREGILGRNFKNQGYKICNNFLQMQKCA
jgi:hypothetical protein